MNSDSKNSVNITNSCFPYLGISCCFRRFRATFRQSKSDLEFARALSKCSDQRPSIPLVTNQQPGRPVNKETRRLIIDLYLVGEGPSAISRSVRVTKGAVWKIIRHYETYDTCPCSRYRPAIYSCTCWCDICRRHVVFDHELSHFKAIIT